MLGKEKTGWCCWYSGVRALVSPPCLWQRFCETQEAMGYPALLTPWVLHERRGAGKQEGAATAPELLQCTQLESQASF